MSRLFSYLLRWLPQCRKNMTYIGNTVKFSSVLYHKEILDLYKVQSLSVQLPITRHFSENHLIKPPQIDNDYEIDNTDQMSKSKELNESEYYEDDKLNLDKLKGLLPSQKKQSFDDRLMKKIGDAPNAEETFELYLRHYDVMNDNHLVALMDQLNELVSDRKEEAFTITRHKVFHQISHHIVKVLRTLEVDYQVKLLKSLSRLEINVNSKIVQLVLQMIRHSINDLDIQQIVYVDFLLRKMPTSPLSQALLIALPMVLENTLKQGMHGQLSIRDLSKILNICSIAKLKGVGLVLQKLYEAGNVKCAQVATSVLWGLIPLNALTIAHSNLLSKDDILMRDILIKECLETMSNNISSLSLIQIETSLDKIATAYTKKDFCCYNEHFFESVSKIVFEKKLNLVRTSHIVSKFLRLNYISDDLNNYLVNAILTTPAETVVNAPIPVTSIISALSSWNSQNMELQHVVEVLISHRQMNKIKDNNKLLWFKLALDLISLNYLYEPLFQVVTDSAYLDLHIDHMRNTEQMSLLRLHQALTILTSTSYRVPEKFLVNSRQWVQTKRPSKSYLKTRIEQLVQPNQAIISGVVTDEDQYIDHLIFLDGEGNPLITETIFPESGNINVANIVEPSKCVKKVAICDISSSMVLGPDSRLKSHIKIETDMLEASGYTVIPVKQSLLQSYNADDKIIYLKKLLTDEGFTQ